MNRKMTVSILSTLAVSALASATVVPFTEHFAADSANWRDTNGGVGLGWVSSGGPDGSAYATGSLNFASLSANSFVNFARGHKNYGSSNLAFTGNWITSGVTTLTFDIRHDAPVSMGFFVRIAGQNNFPAAAILNLGSVPAGQWTQLSFAIDPNNPLLSLEGFPFADVFSAVGNVQIGTTVPQALANVNTTVNFNIDRISIVPAPSALALAGVGLLAAARRKR